LYPKPQQVIQSIKRLGLQLSYQ